MTSFALRTGFSTRLAKNALHAAHNESRTRKDLSQVENELLQICEVDSLLACQGALNKRLEQNSSWKTYALRQ